MQRAATRGQLAPHDPAPAPVSPPPADEPGRLWRIFALGEAGLNECLDQLGRKEAPSEALDLIKRFARHAGSAELRARAQQIVDAQKPRT